ncbi:hypothetical protein ACF5W4_16230 [Bacillota bacterium Lsc_1132]
MSECKLDHSVEDVTAKFESQKTFLSEEIIGLFTAFLEKEFSQDKLNQAFHLLKKYDLASDNEKKARDKQLAELLRQG